MHRVGARVTVLELWYHVDDWLVGALCPLLYLLQFVYGPALESSRQYCAHFWRASCVHLHPVTCLCFACAHAFQRMSAAGSFNDGYTTHQASVYVSCRVAGTRQPLNNSWLV